MKQKIAVLFFVLSFCLSIQTPVAAYNVGLRQDTESYEIQALLATIDIEEELQYAKMGYIDNTINQSILDGIDVWTTDENGEVSYSVRKLGNLETSGTGNNRNTTDGTVYVLAATKTARDDQEGYGMESHLVMGWIDNLGPANELVYVSGSWITGDYTILGRMVDFGVAGAHDVYIESEVHNPTGNTFYYTPENEMVGLKLLAYSTIVSEESDAVEDALYCRVCPTFLD